MFNGIWLVAREPLTLGGREVAAGERFETSRIHSGALLVTGRARLAPRIPPEPVAPPPVPRRRGRPRKVTPETDSIDGTADETPTRRYRRRDLQAEA